MSVGTLTVNLLMKTGQFETDTKRAARASKKMADDIDKQVKQIGAAFAVAAIGAGYFAKSVIDFGDQLFTVSERTGASVENLSKFSLAASQAGTDLDAVGKGLTKLNKAIGLQDENAQLMKQLGVDTTSATTAMLGLADVFKNTQDPAEKAALALQLFGKSGVELVPFLSLGREEIERTSASISTEFAKAADDFNDSIDSLKASAVSLASQGLEPVVTALADVAKGFANLDEYGGGKGYGVFDILGDSVRVFGAGVLTVVEGLKQAWYFMGLLSTGFDEYKRKASSSANNYAESVGQTVGSSKLFGDGVQQNSATVVPFVNKRSVQSNRATANVGRGGNSSINGIRVTPDAKPSATGGAFKVASATKSMANADRDAADAKQDLESATKSLNSVLDDQAVQLGGPLVQAAQDYRDKMIDLQKVEDELVRLHKLDESAVESLKQARDQLTKSYQDQTTAIQDQLTPAEEQLIRMQNELDLLKMTNAERVKAAFLLDNPTATDAQANQAVAIAENTKQTLQGIQAMDQFRNSAADAFKGILDGSMSAKDAFTSFADSVISQIGNIIAQNLTESLFGSFGTAGGGSAGGGIGSFFTSLFAGGRASGGGVSGNKMYRVNENGPEILNYKGDDFLMMGGNSGFVKQRGGGGSSHVTINLPPGSERRTAQQAAQRAGEETSRAIARNR